MAQVQLQDDDPNRPAPQVPSPPIRVDGGLLESAKSAYGGRWDADAQQQFDYRLSRGQTPEEILQHTREDVTDRFPVGPPTGSRGGGAGIGPLFDDPASNQLQTIAQAQMGEVRSNPGLNSLLAFLDKEFSRLSTNPGYSPEDLALLNTQALEPIEARRQADQRRVLERTAARGFLPSSGLTEDLSQQADTEANRQRTVAGRDLAINAIGQRRADLDRALQLGSLRGLDIPRSQRSEELNLSQLLYQLPRNALMDLLAVINGSPSSNDLFSQSLQANQQSLYQQQQNDQRNAALMQQIGAMLGTLFR
jgi:hypothetical protein